jgi:superfamily II DNA or RNA helicase
MSTRARARELLSGLGKKPYGFQTDAAVLCHETAKKGGRLLVQSPTGTGKTLIAQLAVALLAEEYKERFPRVLVVVPTRALLMQHAVDAGWLRSQGLAIHVLHSDVPAPMFAGCCRAMGSC